jgi:hypothetical protein
VIPFVQYGVGDTVHVHAELAEPDSDFYLIRDVLQLEAES